MAANPVMREYPGTIAEVSEEPRLSPDDTWDLIFQMFGSGKELFAEYGGGENFLRAERAVWASHEPV